MGWPILRLERGRRVEVEREDEKGSGLGDNGRGQQALSERRRGRGLQFSSFSVFKEIWV